ncbi:MAG: AAA family ATPase [Sphaerochaetaceae bacterium]|nr:AAA family ATPase [Sphaerochaetaceae bacterium]
MLTDNNFVVEKYDNYKNALKPKERTCFSYSFRFNGNEICYSYEKESLDRAVSETLSINGKEKLAFNRDKSNVFRHSFAGAESLDCRIDNPKLCAVRYLKMNASLSSEDKDNNTFLEFYDFVDRMLLFWCLQNRSYIGFDSGTAMIIDTIFNTNHLKDYNQFLKEAGIDRNVIAKKTPDGRIVSYYDFGGGKLLDYQSNMSNGESSLLLFYYWFLQSQGGRKPSLVFIDEFDAFYHVGLSRFIVEKLRDNLSSQVILTTHNPSLCSNELLRPDSYFILKENRIQSFDKSTDKEIRQVHNLQRMFLAGTFSHGN